MTNDAKHTEKITILGDEDTVIGFKMAGVTNAITTTVDKCETDFLQLITQHNVGIVVIQEDFEQNFSRKTKKMIETLSKPVIVTVPSKTSALGGKKSGSIAELVKRAIGIELKN